MHSSKIYAMYWVPSGYSQPSAYRRLVNRFFTDVAADSGASTNVYSALQQYYDTTGNTAYNATFGGSAIDTNAFPTDGCTLNQYDGWTIQNTTNCLDDTQLQAEIQSFADAQHWDHGPNVQIFCSRRRTSPRASPTRATRRSSRIVPTLITARTTARFSAAGLRTSLRRTSTSTRTCRGRISRSSTAPARIPATATAGDHPNGDGTSAANDANAGDEVIGVTSHEHNEAWSDPLGTGWWVDNSNSAYAFYEDGDLCAWYFPNRAKISASPAIGSGAAYDQVINGHHYFVQGEWSNRSATASPNSGCVWSYRQSPASTRRSPGPPPSTRH